MGVLSRKDQEKLETAKLVEKVMKSPSYKEKMKEFRREDTVHALVKLSFIVCEYMELNHRYKKNGLKKMLEFINKRVGDLPDDEKYFRAANKYYQEELGLNVLSIYGLHMADQDEHKFV